jgi:hypothetical protein
LDHEAVEEYVVEEAVLVGNGWHLEDVALDTCPNGKKTGVL